MVWNPSLGHSKPIFPIFRKPIFPIFETHLYHLLKNPSFYNPSFVWKMGCRPQVMRSSRECRASEQWPPESAFRFWRWQWRRRPFWRGWRALGSGCWWWLFGALRARPASEYSAAHLPVVLTSRQHLLAPYFLPVSRILFKFNWFFISETTSKQLKFTKNDEKKLSTFSSNLNIHHFSGIAKPFL